MVTVVVMAVAVFVIAIWTLGMRAPDLSVIVPVRVAPETWARPGTDRENVNKRTTHS